MDKEKTKAEIASEKFDELLKDSNVNIFVMIVLTIFGILLGAYLAYASMYYHEQKSKNVYLNAIRKEDFMFSDDELED